MNEASPILVVGATGRHGGTGQHLVGRLREAGGRVRVLVRQVDARVAPLQALGAEVVLGDLTDRTSLVAAFADVSSAYFTYPIRAGVVEAAATFASAARERGGRQRIVAMSMAPAHPGSPSPLGRAQWLAEEVFTWAGLDCLILRVAAVFHENLTLLHGRSVREEDEIRNSFGDAPTPWLSGTDAAELAAAALLHPERFGEGGSVQYPPGSELLSHAEVAVLLAEELGRPIRFAPISREAWRSELEAAASKAPDGAINADMATHIAAVGASMAMPGRAPMRAPDPQAFERLTGKKPVTLRSFIQRERAQFTRLRSHIT